jgi:hypothetical protein
MKTSLNRDEAPAPSIFATHITATRGGNDWGPGLDLTLGYASSEAWVLPVPVVKLGGEDVSPQVALIVREGDVLHVEIDLSSIAILVCGGSRQLYLRASAVITAAGDSFNGSVDSTCDSPSGPEPFGWTGTVLQPEHAEDVRRMIAVLARSRHIEQP